MEYQYGPSPPSMPDRRQTSRLRSLLLPIPQASPSRISHHVSPARPIKTEAVRITAYNKPYIATTAAC